MGIPLPVWRLDLYFGWHLISRQGVFYTTQDSDEASLNPALNAAMLFKEPIRSAGLNADGEARLHVNIRAIRSSIHCRCQP